MKYTAQKQIGNEIVKVTIRLDDDCNNGHQDFSITGEMYEYTKGRRETQYDDKPIIKDDKKYFLESGGRIHDDIVRFFPEFKPFVNLHLCDWEGIPMFAIPNGLYRLKNGLSEDQFCKCYNVSAAQYKKLKKVKNEIRYAETLKSEGILNQWKQLANKAIKQLEGLTNEKFICNSTKSNFKVL